MRAAQAGHEGLHPAPSSGPSGVGQDDFVRTKWRRRLSFLPTDRSRQRARQLGGPVGLLHEDPRPFVEQPLRTAVPREPGGHDHRQARVPRLELPEAGLAIHVGHDQVEDHRDRGRRSRALRHRLYERVRYHAHLAADELTRYQEANRLGAGYARWLEGRFVDGADVEGLLRELRQSYRLGAGEKLGYLGARALQ